MKTSLSGLVALSMLALGARAEIIQNEKTDFTGFQFFIPCADGGNGELVTFTGNLHALFTVTFDANGGLRVKTHYQPEGVSGIGAVTGDRYQATGVTQDQLLAKVGQVYTSVNNFRLIGQGTGNNFVVHETYHFTILADGTLAVFHDKPTADCK